MSYCLVKKKKRGLERVETTKIKTRNYNNRERGELSKNPYLPYVKAVNESWLRKSINKTLKKDEYWGRYLIVLIWYSVFRFFFSEISALSDIFIFLKRGDLSRH